MVAISPLFCQNRIHTLSLSPPCPCPCPCPTLSGPPAPAAAAEMKNTSHLTSPFRPSLAFTNSKALGPALTPATHPRPEALKGHEPPSPSVNSPSPPLSCLSLSHTVLSALALSLSFLQPSCVLQPPVLRSQPAGCRSLAVAAPAAPTTRRHASAQRSVSPVPIRQSRRVGRGRGRAGQGESQGPGLAVSAYRNLDLARRLKWCSS